MHHIIPVWEQNPIQLGFTLLFSHTIACFSFPTPSPRTSRNKCISHSPVAEDYPDFKPTFQRIGISLLHLHPGMAGSLFPWEEPTWDRIHAWMAPESAFQKAETATKPVVTTEFLGELFPLIMGIFASDGTWFLSRFFKMKFNTEFRLWSQQCRHKLCLAKHGCPAFLLGATQRERRDGYRLQVHNSHPSLWLQPHTQPALGFLCASGQGSAGRWLQPHNPSLARLSGGCKAPRTHIPAAKAGDSHLPQGRDQREGGLLLLPTFSSIESSISSERRMPYCPAANSMDMDAIRAPGLLACSHVWSNYPDGNFAPCSIPKYSHVGMSGTVLEEAA